MGDNGSELEKSVQTRRTGQKRKNKCTENSAAVKKKQQEHAPRYKQRSINTLTPTIRYLIQINNSLHSEKLISVTFCQVNNNNSSVISSVKKNTTSNLSNTKN